MFDDLTILKDASALARYSAMRHQVIAENIANANTPGYVARDLEGFNAVYAAEKDTGRPIDWRTVESKSATASSPNGNTVSLQEELVRSAQTEGRHETAVAIYRKAIDILRIGLGR
ncbi:MAG: flagellar basal body protein [Pseudomonadota bacterium]